MIKHFILDDCSAPGGKLRVIIVSANRDEMVAVLDQLVKGADIGRLIYYDPSGRNGVDILINRSTNPEEPFELNVSRSIKWGAVRTVTAPALAEEVRNAFSAYPLREAGQKPAEEQSVTFARPKPAPAMAPKAGQLCLF